MPAGTSVIMLLKKQSPAVRLRDERQNPIEQEGRLLFGHPVPAILHDTALNIRRQPLQRFDDLHPSAPGSVATQGEYGHRQLEPSRYRGRIVGNVLGYCAIVGKPGPQGARLPVARRYSAMSASDSASGRAP
jgi:hypothetical protein